MNGIFFLPFPKNNEKGAVPVLQRENGAAEIIKTIISGELRCSASSVVAALTAAVAALATAVASPVAVATAAAVATLALSLIHISEPTRPY